MPQFYPRTAALFCSLLTGYNIMPGRAAPAVIPPAAQAPLPTRAPQASLTLWAQDIAAFTAQAQRQAIESDLPVPFIAAASGHYDLQTGARVIDIIFNARHPADKRHPAPYVVANLAGHITLTKTADDGTVLQIITAKPRVSLNYHSPEEAAAVNDIVLRIKNKYAAAAISHDLNDNWFSATGVGTYAAQLDFPPAVPMVITPATDIAARLQKIGAAHPYGVPITIKSASAPADDQTSLLEVPKTTAPGTSITISYDANQRPQNVSLLLRPAGIYAANLPDFIALYKDMVRAVSVSRKNFTAAPAP